MSEQTLVLIKPDAVARGLVGAVLARYEAKGLGIAALELRHIDAGFADLHYADHVAGADVVLLCVKPQHRRALTRDHALEA